MNESKPLLILEGSCSDAAAWLIRLVSDAGLHVLRTFDLQDSRHAPAKCPCPHHGTGKCDCQMVVLLIYGAGSQPVSLVSHCHDGRAWISMVDSLQQPADPELKAAIQRALSIETTC